MILHKCQKTIGQHGQVAEMTEQELQYIRDEIMYSQFTSKGLKVIAMAYRDISSMGFQ